MHDIKRFTIGAFLSSLLLKEQKMISYKKNPCARQHQDQKRLQSKRGLQAQNWWFEKGNILIYKKSMFLLLFLSHRLRLTLIIPPPPPKKRQNCRFVSLKNVRENSAKPISFFLSPENFCEMGFFFIFRWNLSQIFQQNSCEISCFFHEFVSQNPMRFDFFQWPIRGPVLWTVYVITVLDLVIFFYLSPHFFSSTNVNNVQSWPIVFKKSEGLNYTVY